LGSNLGNPKQNLLLAIKKLQNISAIIVKNYSSIIKTKPVGYLEQPDFYNCVLEIETNYSAHDLLNILQQIEEEMGRKREIRWGPRIIDLDILFYGNKIIHTKDLTVPHQEILNRKFILKSLNEIAPNLVHPLVNKTIHCLYENFSK